MLKSRRAKWLAVIAVVVLVVAVVAYFVVRPYLPGDQPGLGLPSSLPSFVLPSQEASGNPGPAPQTLVAVGDIGSCASQADDAVAKLANRLGGPIASLGDTVYESGSGPEFAQCFDPAWGPMKSRIRPAAGNHEYDTGGAAPYFDYFGAAAGKRGEGWYSYDLGAWHVVVLNSNCGVVGCGSGSPQLKWLQADLARAEARPNAGCLLAYWHHPRWSSGRHGSNAFVQPFWDELERAGVDVILNGHDHDYERVAVDGVQEFVVGTGGRSLYRWPGRPLPTTVTRSDDAYGALWLELASGSYQWQFVELGSSDFQDAGSGTC